MEKATVIALRADIHGLQADMQRAVGIVDGSIGQLRGVATAARTVFAGILGAGGVFGLGAVAGTLREFETLKASLQTVTGSAAGAERALAWIGPFATTTPFSLEEVTGAFIKLKSLGLEPSERALLSYGNTASAMGKSLDQFVEAVADAATGEFERLRDFGIRASTENDRVTFTFRKASTTIQKEASAIEQYLLRIGEVEFGDATALRAATIDGAFSNLADNTRQLIVALGDAGLTKVLNSAARAMASLASAAADALGRAFDTGQIFDWGDALAKNRDRVLELTAAIAALEARADSASGAAGRRVRREISDLRAELDSLQSRDAELLLANATERLVDAEARAAGLSGRNAKAAASAVAAIRAERSRLQEIIARGAGPSAATDVTAPISGQPTTDKAAERAADALAKREAEAIRLLELRVLAENDATEAARIRFEIERGAYAEFGEKSKERLTVLAAEIDGQREWTDLTKLALQLDKQRLENVEKVNQALNAERQRTIESLRTPEESYAAEVRRLLDLGLDEQNLQRGIDAARDSMQGALDKTKETNEAFRDLGLTFESAFESAILGGESLREVLNGLQRDLAAFGLRKFVTEPLFKGLSGALDSGGGIGETIGGLFGDLFGNSRGGLYRVDGGGGAERPIAFTARAGEFVAVGTRMTQGGSGNVNIEIINNTGAAARQEDMGVIDGERHLRIIIGDIVDERLSSAGGGRVLQRGYGLMPRTVNR